MEKKIEIILTEDADNVGIAVNRTNLTLIEALGILQVAMSDMLKQEVHTNPTHQLKQ